MSLALPVQVIYITACAFVDLAVLFINPIIIGVILNDRQMRRQPSIIYIANLALVDLCLATVSLLNILFHFMDVTTVYPICLIFHGYIPLSLITASILFMFTNSIDRFIFIRMSMKYHSIMKSRIARRVAIVIWTCSLMFPLLPNVICVQPWNYDGCSYMSASKSYRYAHVPLQLVFLFTVISTPLMFVSVFRVVKKSRMRHIPQRSTSIESLTTNVSSPSLTRFFPTFPSITELTQYEHENRQNSRRSELEHEKNSEAKIDSPAVENTFPSTLRESTFSTLPVDSPSNLNSPELILGKVEEDGISHARSSIQVDANDKVSDDMSNDRRGRKHSHIRQSPSKQKSDRTIPSFLHSVSESSEMTANDKPECCNESDNLDDVTEDADTRTQNNPYVMSPLVEFYLQSVAVSQAERERNNSLTENMAENNDQSPETISNERKLSLRSHFDKLQSERFMMKYRKTRSHTSESETNFNHQLIKVRKRRKLLQRKIKMTATLPTEPLPMIDFKLETWNTSNTQNGTVSHKDSSTSIVDTSLDMSKHGDLDNASYNEDHQMELTKLHLRALSLGSFRVGRRIRTRTISTSDSSSVISSESTSSFSLGLTNEAAGNLPPSIQFQITHKSSVLRRKPTKSNNRSTYGGEPALSPTRQETSQQRIPACQDGNSGRHCCEHPQRPNALSYRHRNTSVSSTNSSPQLRSPRRPYDRTISTITTSSTCSAPFGTASYSGRDIRTLKILFIMFCVYITLWLPAFIIQFLRYFDFTISVEIAVIGYTFGVSNSVFNFFVYPMRIPKLRVSFKQLFAVAMADLKKNMKWWISAAKRR